MRCMRVGKLACLVTLGSARSMDYVSYSNGFEEGWGLVRCAIHLSLIVVERVADTGVSAFK